VPKKIFGPRSRPKRPTQCRVDTSPRLENGRENFALKKRTESERFRRRDLAIRRLEIGDESFGGGRSRSEKSVRRDLTTTHTCVRVETDDYNKTEKKRVVRTITTTTTLPYRRACTPLFFHSQRYDGPDFRNKKQSVSNERRGEEKEAGKKRDGSPARFPC